MDDSDGPLPVRKSGRQRQPNKKYSGDEIIDLHILDSASEEEAEIWQRLAESSNDEDFDAIQAAEGVNDPEEDDISSATAASDGSGIVTPHEDSDDTVSSASINATPAREEGAFATSHRASDYHYTYRKRKKLDAGTHSRGIADPIGSYAKGAKRDYLYSLFGDAIQDVVHASKSRDQWSEDVTLPRRPNRNGNRGMRHLFSHDDEKRRMEATDGWDWYYVHGGRQQFGRVQKCQPLSSQEGINYVPQPSHAHRTIFMGPYGRQSRFHLPMFQSMPLDEAWKHARQHNSGEEHDAEPSVAHKLKDGWLLNVGTGVRCSEWAPNHAGDRQYLALSTLQPKDEGKIGHLQFSPAFTAQSSPSSIQIWSFSSTEAPHSETLLRPDLPPCLQMVICTDWGDPKQLRWCHIPRAFRNCDQEGGKIPLGLLACVWSDGHVRVLDIHLEHADEERETTYIKYTTAAFTAKPPSTLCTCVTWLSPTELAVGCANGSLVIWSIYPRDPSSRQPSQASQTPTSHSTSISTSPPPLLYTPLYPSYILSLATAYPLSPHLLATSSASGHLRLTSLRSPTTDYVLSPRMRHAPSQIHFSEPAHAFLTADDNDSVKAWPIRRFFSPINVARIPSPGLCLAPGNFHASVLVGCADGHLCAVNPLRKLLWPKAMSWQLPVLKHEWRRATAGERERGEAGRVRITEGFKMREANMVQGTRGGTGKAVEGVVIATVWEEEGQVRSVAWGRDVKVGGWVAVGFGSGLVRVEDLAIGI